MTFFFRQYYDRSNGDLIERCDGIGKNGKIKLIVYMTIKHLSDFQIDDKSKKSELESKIKDIREMQQYILSCQMK